MTLVVDIGNTNIVCGIYRDSLLVWHARFKTDRGRTSDEYFASLIALKAEVWTVSEITQISLASVVPELTRIWQHLFQKYFNASIYNITGYTPLGLSYNVSDPGFIGADLIINAFAAWKKYRTACIICDFGTATTIQYVTAQGRFMGTVIAPGIRTAAAQLFDKAALLSEIELSMPSSLLGTNTKDAMLSGIITGHALMIESFVFRLRKEFASHNPITAIATGGIADMLMPMLPSIDVLDKVLTLEGLFFAANHMKDAHQSGK